MKYLYIIVLLLLSISSYAVTKYSNNTGGGEWKTGASWQGGIVPANGDTVIIRSGDVITVSNNGTTNRTVGSIGTPFTHAIIVNGTLSLVYTGGNFPANFTPNVGMWLSNTSIVLLNTGGQLTSSSNNTFFGDTNFISLGVDFPPVIEYVGGIDGTVTGPDSFVPGNAGPLPIELISFNATLLGNVIEISWATAAEIDNDYFTLERSEDGINWNIIGEEKGAGNSTVRLDYRFVDYNPIPGLSYYRLKQTDYDGQFEYFDPAVVLYEPDNPFKVFPNPTTDYIQLTTSSELNNAVISIKNMNGQAQSISIDPSNHQANIDLSGLPTGVYLLEIVFPESVLSKRIVKK
jgi:hypothetical protein